MAASVTLMTLAYVVPLGVGAAADPHWHCWKVRLVRPSGRPHVHCSPPPRRRSSTRPCLCSWTLQDGSLSHVARLIGGPFLGGWVLLSALVSNWGLFASELLEDSFQLLGMAQATSPRSRRSLLQPRVRMSFAVDAPLTRPEPAPNPHPGGAGADHLWQAEPDLPHACQRDPDPGLHHRSPRGARLRRDHVPSPPLTVSTALAPYP